MASAEAMAKADAYLAERQEREAVAGKKRKAAPTAKPTRVLVPAGWKPGLPLIVTIGGSRKISVEVPADAIPGKTILEFTVPHAGQ